MYSITCKIRVNNTTSPEVTEGLLSFDFTLYFEYRRERITSFCFYLYFTTFCLTPKDDSIKYFDSDIVFFFDFLKE